MDGRNAKGQFTKGNKLARNGGRRKRSTEQRYLNILRATVTPDDWEIIIRTAIARAKAGDNVARQWLSDWMLGKPIERKELSGMDGGPIAITRVEIVEPDGE